ncbi:MAG: S-layer homology domain-containing protein [Oscillibacter ruminantium]|uniref:GH25 family lysozyme n=1 Tax=Oscillibacter ruminantium TaxID=1263547 RepID=UPI002B213709|nr:GH25 family lysozyme [Oscillibacter ruminantium]MEA5041642.1 S-layer homology domain-containing protein [Oscillibacter ruminantium]
MAKFRIFRAAAALTLSAALLTQPISAAAFTDTLGHWAESAIEKWSEKYGVIKGYEDATFHPDAPITRGAFAGILNRFLQYQKISPNSTFKDTSGAYWEDAILRLHAAGVYLGTDGAARLTANITRQQAITMVGRAFKLLESTAVPAYADVAQIESYASGYLGTMAERGYITDVGADNRFRPTEPITRAELINLLNNMVDTLIQQSGDYSTSTKGTLMINAADGATLNGMSIGGDLIIAPGVTGGVVLQDVTLSGTIQNLGSATVDQYATTPPENPGTTTPPPAENVPSLNWTYITGPDGKKIPYYEGVPVNTFGNGSFYWNDAGRLVYSGTDFTTRFGIDVSAYQNRSIPSKTIDWNAAKNDGVEFVFARIGFRGTGSGTLNSDAFYAQNIDGAMAAGLDTGVYFFSQAITVAEAVEEANYVLSLLGGRKLTAPIAYDWEMHDSTYRVYGTSSAMATACAKAFCETIEAAGYQAMVYTSSYVAYNKFDLSVLSKYPVWYPEYKSASSTALYPQLYYRPNYWQFTSKGSVAGLSGNVDCNLQFIPN